MGEKSIWMRERAVGGTGRPPKLDRADIVAAAITVAEADGLAAVTMRRVASQLGSGTASLYRHLRTRDDLLDLMIDQVLQRYQPPAITGEAIADVVAELMNRLRFVRSHPWLIEAIDARPGLSPERIRLIELGLERLASHPGSGPAKMEALTVLTGMLHLQAGYERDGQAMDPQVVQTQIKLLHRAARDGAHPHLAHALSQDAAPTADEGDDRFAQVLTRILRGLLPPDPA